MATFASARQTLSPTSAGVSSPFGSAKDLTYLMVSSAAKGENVRVNQQPRQAPGAATRRSELNRRLRLAFISGAEERSRREVGRGLSAVELERVLHRYPGDLPKQ